MSQTKGVAKNMKKHVMALVLVIVLAAAMITACQKGNSITIKDAQYSISLTELDLSGENLQDEDIAALESMTNLTALYLSKNQISNLTPLAGLEN